MALSWHVEEVIKSVDRMEQLLATAPFTADHAIAKAYASIAISLDKIAQHLEASGAAPEDVEPVVPNPPSTPISDAPEYPAPLPVVPEPQPDQPVPTDTTTPVAVPAAPPVESPVSSVPTPAEPVANPVVVDTPVTDPAPPATP